MTTETSPNPDPQELFAIGVRAFVLQDYNQAAEVLSQATELLVQEHKDNLHDSLGKIYLVYGKALLGLAKSTIEPLKEDNLKNNADDSDDAIDENGEASAEPAPTEAAKASEEPSAEEPEEEEDDDLEIAWEVLEYAKKIFEKQEDKKQLAEALIALGEVSLESGNHADAIADIKAGLDLQKELLGNDSRTVAETLYKLGMAYCIENNMDEAIKNFQESQLYLNNRIKTLEETEIQNEDVREEIEEIRELMPNIDEKIEELRDYKTEREKIEKEILKTITGMSQKKDEVGNNSSQVGASTSSGGPVSNISHLVKRKRKSDEMDKK